MVSVVFKRPALGLRTFRRASEEVITRNREAKQPAFKGDLAGKCFG